MKKIISLILTILIATSTVSAAPIYEYKNEETIYNGITHIAYNRLYSDKNVKFDVIRADLNKSHLKLELLKSTEGTDILDNVKNLAKTNENTVVASNADFFSVYKGNKGFSLGLEIKDKKILQSPINTQEMAGAFFKENSLTLSYFNFTKTLVAPSGETLNIRHTNKHTTYYGDLLMYTSDFNNGLSPAPGGEVVEMVVQDNKVVEFRRNMPPVEIPENGYILVVSEGSSMFLANNFNIDDEVKIEISASPSIDNTETAFGGGTLLVKDGKITPITHNVSGNNPRTAIGTDASGKIIYIVTVDGRQILSKGVTLEELAEIMIEIGCYNALNLDGGGSTNLVAKTPFNSEIHSINNPTENRKVINAVGITSSAYPSKPSSVKIKTSQDYVFIDDFITLEARIFDKYLNPVWNGDKPVIKADFGKISDTKYYPSRGGIATLTAQYNQFKDEKVIKVIDDIISIKLNDTLYLDPLESERLNISVIDKDGTLCKVDNFTDFKITSLTPSTVSYKDKLITAKKTGVGYIKVQRNDITSYIKVIVGNPGIEPYSDNFETINATFTSYPDEYVPGSYEISNDFYKSGKSSGKLSYDFTNEEYNDTMAAYMVFNSIPITDRAESISFDVYSSEEKGNLQLKVQFTDGKGNTAYRLIATEGIKKGWQNIKLKIPNGTVWPLKLTRIYVVQPPTEEKNKGELYFDNLNVNINYNEQIAINKDYNTINDDNYGLSNKGITFKFAGVPDSPTSILDKVAYQNLLKSISDADVYALIGKYNYKEAHANKTPLDTSFFSTLDKYDCTFINLHTENGSIRSYSSSQWDSLNSKLKSSNKNIFILINGKVDTETFEGQTFIDLLKTTNKNVYVISNSSITSLHKYANVHIFEICDTADGFNLDDKLFSANILEFNLVGNDITYEFKRLYK